jgi:hypothetical protein
MTNKAKLLWLAFILVGVAIKAGARPERLGVSIDPRGSDGALAVSRPSEPDRRASVSRPVSSTDASDNRLDNFNSLTPVIGAIAKKNCLYLTFVGRRSADIETESLCPFFHVFDN